MGIKKLNYMIKQYAGNSVTVRPLSDYKNTIMAIDCSIILYKYIYLSTGQFSYINGFINRTKCYLKHNIIPVYVFDGIPPEEKTITINKRVANKTSLIDRISELKNRLETANEDTYNDLSSEIKKLESQLIYVNKYHIMECKEVLDAMGIPFVQAPGEGEKMCVYLQKVGLVDHIVTDDTDVFPFGCRSVLKTSMKNNMIIEVNKNKILEGFGFTEAEFLDFCILCGCDYTQPVYNVGGITSYNLIKKYGSLDEVKVNTKYNIAFDIDKIRTIFTDYSEIDKPDTFILKTRDVDKLNELCKKFNLRKNIFNY